MNLHRICFIICAISFTIVAHAHTQDDSPRKTTSQEGTRTEKIEQFYKNAGIECQYISAVDFSKINTLNHTIKSKTNNSTILVTPPVGNQYNYNTCTGWAVCYAAASILLYEEWLDMDSALCSPQYLYNQYSFINDTTKPKDCNNSFSDIFIIVHAMRNQGVCSYNLMPYDTSNCTEALTYERQINAIDRRFSYQPLPTLIDSTISLFKQAIDHGRPIVVDMPIYDSFITMWNSPTAHGVWNNVDTTMYDLSAGRHATCIVGYDDTKSAFKVMNSWGTDGGDNGFYWATYNVVQQGCFKRALILRNKLETFIEGPTILSDSAWYYIRNVPEGATITWSINNISATPFEFVTASVQNRDSMYVAFRQISYNPPGPGIPISGYGVGADAISRYQNADLTVTISAGTNSYSTTKRIKKLVSSFPYLSTERDTTYTLELWHPNYGVIYTQETESLDKQIDTHGLPQGLYVQILKDRNGTIINRTKIMIH